jgi:hypothetical protein
MRLNRTGAVELSLALAVVAWCGWRLSRGIGPAPSYNSDSGVTMLLVQGYGSGPFTFFYPGQDRLGAWPFLAARALRLRTPEAFHAFSTLGLLAALVPLSRLLGGVGLAVLVLFSPLFLNRVVVANVFEIGQPYLWQIVSLCWAWWALRSSLSRGGPWAVAGLLLASSLAIWLSRLSLPALLGLLVVEAILVRKRMILGPLVAIGLGALVEGQLRRWHRWACRREYGDGFVVPMPLDRGFFGTNLVSVLAGCWQTGIVVPLAVGTALLLRPGATRRERANLAALVWLAVMTLPALVLVHHFRENLFAARYFAFSAFWTIAAATYGLATLAFAVLPRARTIALCGLLLALAWVCPSSPGDALAGPRAEAARLAGAHPRVYLDGYWQTYVTASVGQRGQLIPLVIESEQNRFPMLRAALAVGAEVLAPCALAPETGVASQYGAVLRRIAAPSLSGLRGPVCLYAVERPAEPLRRPDR